MAISFVIHIISLKKWSGNRGKNEKLLEMMQSLHTGNEKLSERIHIVETDNQNLLKSYGKIADRTSLQEGNLYTIQIISKDEKIPLMEKFKTLESHVQNENQKLIDLMKSLQIFTGQEIQTLKRQ